MEEKTPRIVNLHDLPMSIARSHKDRYASSHAFLGTRLGATKLGYNLTEVPPGKTAFPYHFHHVNEELFLVLEGTGTLRWAGGKSPIEAGDLISCPPGPDGVHQILNEGEGRLVYLALSTMLDPEVVEYPDSGKYGVISGRPPDGRREEAAFSIFARKDAGVDYWSGED